MVDILFKGDKYKIKLDATESIEITINGTQSAYSRTIPTGKVAVIDFELQENPI